MSGPAESYILCEGYHDRAFWAGLLLRLGCTDLSLRPGGRHIKPIDPFKLPLGAGHYAFASKSGGFIRVVPAMGKQSIPPAAKTRLRERAIKGLSWLVINSDSDRHADGSPVTTTEISVSRLWDIIRESDASASQNSEGDFDLTDGTKVSLIAWRSADPVLPGTPNQHTLERIICGALIACHPQRAQPVQNWLDSRPDPAPAAGPKEYAWSYLAGWYADTGGYEGFCERIWKEPDIARELEVRLKSAGIWRVAEALST